MTLARKRYKIGIALILSIALCGCSSKTDKDSIDNYTNTFKIADINVDNNYESLYFDKNSNRVYEVKNSDIVAIINTDYTYSEKNIQKLDETSDTYNILEEQKELYAYTYKSDVSTSSKVINYFKENGYEIVQQVDTQDFIDISMKNKNEIKRFLITPTTISICSVEDKEFNIVDYVK